MDLLGRKVTMQKGKAFTCLLEEINKTIMAATEDSELMHLAKELIGAVENLKKVTSHLVFFIWKESFAPLERGSIGTTIAPSDSAADRQ
jgi:hypothetical protein